MVRLLAAVAALAAAVVVSTAVPSASEDDQVTWEQVRAARLATSREAVSPPAASSAPAPSGSMVLTVTIPDLSWALDDPTAPTPLRRAACHQATGTDDETAGPLSACLRHVEAAPGEHRP